MITEFTPLHAVLGGTLIGVSAVALMAFHGRIAGITGIASGLLKRDDTDKSWRVAFLFGAILVPMLIALASGQAMDFANTVPTWAVLAGGLAVGVGVSFGGGCTSGHGVCGIARLSTRSIVATVTFMLMAFLTVFVIRHVFGGF